MRHPKTFLVIVGTVAAIIALGASGVLDAADMPGPAQVSLVILIVAAVLWISEIVPLFVTSFIILALSTTWLVHTMEANGLEVSKSSFTAPFFSDVILLFLGGFVLSAAMHKYKLDERLARRVIAKTGGSVPLLVLSLGTVTAFLSMWLSNTATAAMMLALCLPILRSLPAGDSARKAILLVVPFSANVGGMGTPIGTPPNAIAIEYMRDAGTAPSFLTWVIVGAPIVVIMLAVIWGVLMLLYPARGRRITVDTTPFPAERGRATLVVVAVTLLTAIGWLTSGVHHLSSGTIALLPLVVLFGGRLLDTNDLRSLSWDVLLMMGGGLSLGVGIAQSGLAEWLVHRIPVDTLGATGLFVVLIFTACLMSSAMSNTAAANLLLPIVAGLPVTPLAPMLMSVAFSCSLAMVLPISTPPNAIAFSSDEITARDMIKPGLILSTVGLVLVLTLGRWWGGIVGVG